MGWRITGTDLSVFGTYKAVAFVRDDGRVVDTDVWNPNILCEICDDGDIRDPNNGLYGRSIGRIRYDGGVENSDGRTIFWIHSNGSICDSYEALGNYPKILGHVEKDGEASGFLGQILSNRHEQTSNSNYNGNTIYKYPVTMTGKKRRKLNKKDLIRDFFIAMIPTILLIADLIYISVKNLDPNKTILSIEIILTVIFWLGFIFDWVKYLRSK